MSIHDQHLRTRRHRSEPAGLFRRLSTGELADLLAPIHVSAYAGGSEVDLRWCDYCGGWMLEGSKALGCCVTCGTPRPAEHADR